MKNVLHTEKPSRKLIRIRAAVDQAAQIAWSQAFFW
jgi:hypothetical protein